MITLSDVKTDRGIQRIAGYCPDSEDFVGLVNDSGRRCLRRGDFAGSIQPIYLCVRSGCVVWPRYVKAVRAMSWCGRGMKTENMWGSFLPRGGAEPWRSGLRWCSGSSCKSAMVDQGRTSVFQDIQGDGRLIRVYARCSVDWGKTLTFFGTDNNGQELMTTNLDGSHTRGVTVTLADPYATVTDGVNPIFIRHIDYVLKDVTQCPVNVYAYWAAEDVLEDIAQYDPTETRPSYRRTKITLPWAGTGACNLSPTSTSCCDTNRGVAALVKLDVFPIVADTDLVLPDNLDAIKMMIQAIKLGEAGDRQNAKLLEMDAITELNRQLDDENPDDQFVAEDYVFAGQTFTNRCF